MLRRTSTAVAERDSFRVEPDSGIAWETLPSLANRLLRQAHRAGAQPVWADTQPVDHEAWQATAEQEPESEALPGLVVREVLGLEVFRHFFGR